MDGTETSRQLELFGAVATRCDLQKTDATKLASLLTALLSEPVHLTVHDNRSTMLSFRRLSGRVHYRVHHMFLGAPDEVVRALAAFAGTSMSKGVGRRQAGDRIDAFVRQHRGRIGPRRPITIDPQGRHHDLQAIFDQLNSDLFGGAIDARIGWGSSRRGRRRRTIKTGVYVHDARLIRIHPALDCSQVPKYYVAAVVFHEMLHQVVPAIEGGARRIVHGREFRSRESGFPDHERAKSWERANLHFLLTRT